MKQGREEEEAVLAAGTGRVRGEQGGSEAVAAVGSYQGNLFAEVEEQELFLKSLPAGAAERMDAG
jgi:hypothetical protein